MFDLKFGNYSIVFENKLYTSEMLAETVAKEKQLLSARIPSNERPVGIYVSRSPRMLTLMQTMLELGMTFVPVSAELPAERIAYIIKDSGVEYVVTDIGLPCEGCTVIRLDEETDPAQKPVYVPKENDLAYIIYTSGTTGAPKGVEIPVAAIRNFLNVLPLQVPVTSDSRMISASTNTFDIIFGETLLPMKQGATIVLAAETEQANPAFLCKLIRDHNVDTIEMTPSRMMLIANYDKELENLQCVRTFMLGGEAFPKTMLRLLQEKTNARIFNMYGPAEATVWATVAELTHETEICIGDALKGITVYIGNDSGEPLPAGETGEICIEGICLARGYHNNPQRTSERFIQKNGKTVYLTGDLGRVNEAGRMIHLGRNDTQVKIRGYRVELEEIDMCMMSRTAVSGAAACYLPGENGGQLVAFYTAGNEIPAAELSSPLKTMLPQYMIPSAFIRVEKLLFTHSGKPDRKNMLREYLPQTEKPDAGTTPKAGEDNSSVRRKVSDIICACIGTEEAVAGAQEDLRDCGMDSLKFISVVVAIEEAFDIEFEDEMLSMGRLRTIGQFADYAGKLISDTHG